MRGVSKPFCNPRSLGVLVQSCLLYLLIRCDLHSLSTRLVTVSSFKCMPHACLAMNSPNDLGCHVFRLLSSEMVPRQQVQCQVQAQLQQSQRAAEESTHLQVQLKEAHVFDRARIKSLQLS